MLFMLNVVLHYFEFMENIQQTKILGSSRSETNHNTKNIKRNVIVKFHTKRQMFVNSKNPFKVPYKAEIP